MLQADRMPLKIPKIKPPKQFEKDIDDHFVVVVEPWSNGIMDYRDERAINWMGAWLRIVFHKPDEMDVVRAIYTIGQV